MTCSSSTISPGLKYYYPVVGVPAARHCADVVIYGATSGGVAAAVQLARLGRSVLLVEFGRHVGGLSAGGLGATDIGNKAAIGGLAREFYIAVGRCYGASEKWTFEPHVAEAVFHAWLDTANIAVHFEQRLARVTRDGLRISELNTEAGAVFEGKIFIDATYEGDLLAAAGVSYHVGREGNAAYNEIYNGVFWGHPNHNFRLAVDPYRRPGDPASGLLPGVFPGDGGRQGEGDHRVQAYNFRMCLTKAATRRPFPKPPVYDPLRYEILRRYIEAGMWDVLGLTKLMPNGKTDTNNFGAFSSDNIGRNDRWPEGSYAEREEIFQDHVNYHQGLFWFLAHDERLPARVREEMGSWGLPADEFSETGGWPHQLYVREARRMVGAHIMTEHECVWGRVVSDPVGLAAYQMDSHNCNRVVKGGRVFNEGNVEIPVGNPYGISYRALIPRAEECTNLIVPVCVSSSHIAFGSIRMEPVFMVLGQSAAFAADLALENDGVVQNVPYAALRVRLLEAGQVLLWQSDAFAVRPLENEL